jgi:dCTP diphosphatase
MQTITPQEKLADDRYINISHVNRQFREIAVAKGWQAYHTPKNLAAAVAVESSELLAEFQWLTPPQSQALTADKKQKVAYEVADVILYLSELCVQLDIDMGAVLQEKYEFNKKRFITPDVNSDIAE